MKWQSEVVAFLNSVDGEFTLDEVIAYMHSHKCRSIPLRSELAFYLIQKNDCGKVDRYHYKKANGERIVRKPTTKYRTKSEVKSIILDYIRQNPGTTRYRICQHMRMSNQQIEMHLVEMIHEGTITDIEKLYLNRIIPVFYTSDFGGVSDGF